MLGLRLLSPAGQTLSRVSLRLSQNSSGNFCGPYLGLSGARSMASLKNWKRPSMDELPPPTEPYVQADRKRQSRYNTILFVGAAFLGFTIAFAKVSGIIQFYGTPSFAYTVGNVSKKEGKKGDDDASNATDDAPELIEAAQAEPDEEVEKQHQDVSADESEAAITEPVEQQGDSVYDIYVPYLLIGGGTATFSAFRAIKSIDAKAKILIVGDENRLPYMRPPLSKELWYGTNSSGEGQVEDVPGLKFKQWNGRDRPLYYEPESFYTPVQDLASRDNGGISMLKGHRVTRINAEKQTAHLDDGRTIKYEKCLIATGGSPKTIPMFDSLMEKVTLFRKLDDYFRLVDIAKKVQSVAVIGGGFLGSELACALAAWTPDAKLEITQIFPEHGNMAKVLPEYLSKWTTEKVRSEGVRVFPNSSLTSAILDPVSNQLVLTTSQGDIINADHVIVAVGIEPDTSIAKESNLEIDHKLGGFKVNEELEARPNVWVAGDAASFNDVLLGRRRVEHHDNAVVSGRLAGENMTGRKKQYTHQSMFWSDLGAEIGYEAIGLVDPNLPTVGVFAKATSKDTPREAVPESGETLRKSETETEINLPQATQLPDEKAEDYGKGVIFYLKDDVVVGVLLWNVFNKISVARKVIKDHKKYEDLSEVAKLFNLHQKLDEE